MRVWKRNNNIMAGLLPLFPLQLVVFPGSAVPLHIFEQRYREMVGEAEAAGTEFGIVFAKEGGIVDTGCTVMVETFLQALSRWTLRRHDPRPAPVSHHRRSGKDYLRGKVEYFEDEEADARRPNCGQSARGLSTGILDSSATTRA